MAKVLVLDDDPQTLYLVEQTLASAGHRAVLLDDPDRAVEVAQRERVDAFILDLKMPRTSGLEVLQALLAEPGTRPLPVLFLSAVQDVETRVQALRAGGDDFLVKPFDPQELTARIERLLARSGSGRSLLEGNLSFYPLFDLLQSLEHGGKTGELCIQTPNGDGEVQLVSGQVTSASFDRLRDTDALLALVEQRQGRFRFTLPPREEVSAQAPTRSVVRQLALETAWLRDELEKRKNCLPPTDQPLWVVGSLPPGAERALPGVPLRPAFELIRETPGTVTTECIAQLSAPPLKTRLALAWLVEAGAVSGVDPATPEEVIVSPEAVHRSAHEWLQATAGVFLASALARGLPMAPCKVLLLVSPLPTAWRSFRELLQPLPPELIDPAALRQLTAPGSCVLRLPLDLGEVELQILPLLSSELHTAARLLEPCAGAAAWIADPQEAELLRSLGSRLDTGKDLRGLAFSLPGGPTELPPERRSATFFWRLLTTPPVELADLFALLT